MAELTKKGIGGFLARQGILVAFVLFMVGFALANQRFIAIDNIFGVIRSSAILGVMALGVTFVVIGGNLDLSVGSMMSFSTIVVLDLHDTLGPTLAIPAMFGLTLALGAFIGFLVGYLKLNSLIVTLGMLSAIHGLTLTWSGGQNMDIADKEGTWFGIFGRGDVLGVPMPIVIFGTLAIVLSLVLFALASWLRSTVPLVVAWACLFVFLPAIGELLRRVYDVRAWKLLSLWRNIRLVGNWCFGAIREQDEMLGIWAGLIVALVCVICLVTSLPRLQPTQVVQ